MLGFEKSLYFLPFDHRSTFVKGLFPDTPALNEGQLDQIRRIKQIIYEGLKKSVTKGIPKENAAVLVDEQFGDTILKDAKREGFISAVTVEKSGQDEFDFEFGSDYDEHILKYQPTFAKALVRFNPEGDQELNTRQLTKLKELSDFVHSHEIKLLIEPLVVATESQLAAVAGDKHRYDRELRPDLEVSMIKAFQDHDVAVDVWKIEGFEQQDAYEKVAQQARCDNREQVAIIILGRGSGKDEVIQWLTAGSKVVGVTGFAVGRTVFWDPVMEFFRGRIDGYQASEEIADNFVELYHVFSQ